MLCEDEFMLRRDEQSHGWMVQWFTTTAASWLPTPAGQATSDGADVARAHRGKR